MPLMRSRPHIMVQGGVAEAAIALWQSAFPDFHVIANPEPPAMLWQLAIGYQRFTLFDSPQPHEFAPTPSWSWMIDLDAADDVDRIAGILATGGQVLMPADTYEFAQRFAWVEDRFGISWQLRHGSAE